jgi:TetR/AcrR family tetracycline transcriptional repressor
MATKKGPAEPLTRERIVDTALTVIDRTGLESLSMRRLGAELGVEAMAIYHWFPSKDAVLDGIVERLLASGEPYPADLAWADTYRWACTRLLGSVAAHPAAAGMLAIRPLDTPAAHEWLERPLSAARKAGFTDAQAAELSHAVLAYLVGWIVMSRTPDTTRASSAKGPSAMDVAAVAPEAARVRAQMAEWGKGFDDGLDA